MADPLLWKDGAGYDIHVLRGGPPSAALDSCLVLDTGSTAQPPRFSAHFKGAPSNFGIDVDAGTGAVRGAGQPGGGQPKFPNFNFLITAKQVVGGVSTKETTIRIHIHDTVQKIWLSPASLTIHLGANECRFSVLALFDDNTIGDITDWDQLTYQIQDQSIVGVQGPAAATASKPPVTAGVLAAGRPIFRRRSLSACRSRA